MAASPGEMLFIDGEGTEPCSPESRVQPLLPAAQLVAAMIPNYGQDEYRPGNNTTLSNVTYYTPTRMLFVLL